MKQGWSGLMIFGASFVISLASMMIVVMLVVSLEEEEMKRISDQVSDLAFDFMMKYGVDISPIITNTDHFNYWADNLPYYRNVRDEGVKLGA